jgi:hypothetical protein
VVDEAGRMHVFLGTFDPSLATRDPVTGAWSYRTHPGLSLSNNGSYGGITAFGNYVYLPDMTTFGGEDGANGIIRFNLADNTSQRFAEGGFEFINLARGYDGLLYALGTGGSTEANRVRVYNPITMDLVRDVPLASDVRGIVADAAGNMYGGSWGGQVFKFSPTGQVLDTLTVGGNFSDIDMARDGTIVVGDWFDSVVYTDPSLDTFRRVAARNGDSEFVAFTDPIPEPATLGLIAVVAGWLGLRRRR